MVKTEITLDFVRAIIENKVLTKEQKVRSIRTIFSDIENFPIFCQFFFPLAFNKPFAKFHKELILDFNSPGNSADAAPRGSAKSTIIGLGYVLWLIAYKREDYLVYTSQNHMKSVQFVEPVIREVKYNSLYKFIYNISSVKSLVDEEDGVERQDVFDINGVRIQAISFEKNIRGLKYRNKRPTLIILDDIEEDMRVINPLLRRKDSDKLNRQIIPSLDADRGRFKMIGTILHHDSLLVQKIQNLNGRIYRVIEEDGTLLWPEMFSKDKLDKIRYEIGSAAFQSEYLNNPVDDASSIIKRDWVRSCFDSSISFGEVVMEEKFDFKVQGVDFAFSDRITADKSAFLGLGKSSGYTILSCFTKQGLTITQQFEYIEYLSGTYGFNDNALEENSIRSMSNELKNYTFPYTLFWTGAHDGAYKVAQTPEYDNKRHTVGKTSLIHRLATVFERNFNSINEGAGFYLRIPYKTDNDKRLAHQIMDECCTLALQDGKMVEVGVHGDIVIALAYALERCEMETFNFSFGALDLGVEV